MKKTIIGILILLCLTVSFCACHDTDIDHVDEPTDSYSYSSKTVLYNDMVVVFKSNMESTETELAEYVFEKSVTEEERISCINATERILSNLDIEDTKPSFCVFTPQTYDDIYISDNTVFLCPQSWNSVEYIATVLSTACGRFTNYGLIYGYANYLGEKIGWFEADAGNYSCPSNLDTCDINLLCFDVQFTSAEDVACAKNIAIDFVDRYIAVNGEAELIEMLSCSDTAEGLTILNKELQSYYSSNGLKYVPSSIMYGFGGKTYDYVVYSEFGKFYIDKDFVDKSVDYNPMITFITRDFLHKNYSELKLFFETNVEQMRLYQEFFAIEGYNNDLDIVISNSKKFSGSLYQGIKGGDIHLITLNHIASLMHEYIHSITIGTITMPYCDTLMLWQCEGFSRYYQRKWDNYGNEIANQDYATLPSELLMRYSEIINRPIDFSTDSCGLHDFIVYDSGVYSPNHSYEHGASFIAYLVDKFGDEAVIHSIYGRQEPLPQSYDELLAEWTDYIKAKYSE